jgi:hypothetical protein
MDISLRRGLADTKVEREKVTTALIIANLIVWGGLFALLLILD